jgi:hypothetical protein
VIFSEALGSVVPCALTISVIIRTKNAANTVLLYFTDIFGLCCRANFIYDKGRGKFSEMPAALNAKGGYGPFRFARKSDQTKSS